MTEPRLHGAPETAPAGPAAGPKRRLGALGMVLFLILLGLATWHAFGSTGFVEALEESAERSPSVLYRTLVAELFLNPWLYAVFGLVLLLEQFLPARPGQGLFSIGLREDFLWMFVKMMAHAAFLPLYVVLLRFCYDEYLGFLTIHAVADWPWLARFFLALLFGDFVFWLNHFIRHKVGALWHFHAVHHSQRELNFLTEYRVHPIDDLFVMTLGFIPLFMVSHSFVSVVTLVWLRHWHSRLYHGNIRTDFGPLRYLLVTPQSHRVHHSRELKHQDKNFGLTFSIWDHLFGTQYRGYDEYPETGIADESFPLEQEGKGFLHGVAALLGQLLYPFRALARS